VRRRLPPGTAPILLAALCLGSASAFGQAPAPTPRAEAEPPEHVLLLIGDSITLGAKMGEPVGPAFPELLARRVAGSVQNLGCGGTSALDWLPYSELSAPPCRSTWWHYRDLVKPELPARIVGVLLGTNDATGFGEVDHAPVSAERYGWAITVLSGRLLSDGAGSVLLMTPPHNHVTPEEEVDLRLRSYRDEIVRICDASREDDVHCGPDLYTALGPEFFANGNLHPNGAAHAWIADQILAWCSARPPAERCEAADAVRPGASQ
jgi:lysophospholipase L1-like esterase